MCENIYIDIYRYKIIFTYILHSTEPSWLQKGQRNFVAKNTFFFVTTFFCFFLLLPIFVSYTCYNVLFLLSYCSVLFLVYIRLYIVFRDDIKFINILMVHHFNFNLSSSGGCSAHHNVFFKNDDFDPLCINICFCDLRPAV